MFDRVKPTKPITVTITNNNNNKEEMEHQQTITEAPPDTKKMIRQLQETTVVASDMLEKLHVQGGMNQLLLLFDY